MNIAIISAAIVLNLLLLLTLLIVVPRLLRRHETHTTDDALRLREMLLDVLSEQEAVTLRQNQIGATLAGLNRELARMAEGSSKELAPEVLAAAAGVPQLERRLEALHAQLGGWFERSTMTQHQNRVAQAENWGNLVGLLANIQDNIGTLNSKVATRQEPQHNAANVLLGELEDEMQHMRDLAVEVADMQLKLRRSLLERETHLASLRAQVLGVPSLGNRAA